MNYECSCSENSDYSDYSDNSDYSENSDYSDKSLTFIITNYHD